MRILFDSSPAEFTPGGTRTYIQNLATSLQGICAERKARLFISDIPDCMRVSDGRGFAHKIKVAGWDTYYMHWLLNERVRSIGANLVHAPAFRIPLFSPVPVIVTLLDTTILASESLHRGRDRLVLGFYMRAAAKKAAHIITISQNSRQDIHRLLGIDLNRITVTYPGVSPLFQSVGRDKIEQVLQHNQLPQPYILSVCTLEPRKNLSRVLEAYTTLKVNYNIPHHLVLVGKRGWMEDPIFDTVKRLKISKYVHFTGFVDDADLPALYTGASVFVYPSLYEGFGLPVLEAMACGTPVVTSNTSSLPEVIGDAGLLVNPQDIRAIADAIWQVINDSDLAASLRTKGFARSRFFSWEKCAEQTFDVYRDVASRV